VEHLIPLDDARARDPAIAGHKGAELARATAAGMPALPGWVLPLGESAAAARAAARADRGGSAAASVLAVSALELGAQLRLDLAAAVEALGGTVVVRSSSPLEVDPRWSGAFATYLDVHADEVDAAVRGCWASAFTRDARSRAEILDIAAIDRPIAVVIQPWIVFDGGGVATLDARGAVEISAIRGAPADLVGGRRDGTAAHVDPTGGLHGDVDLAGLGAELARAVASLVREVHAATGNGTIEWGVRDGTVTLLQARRAAPAASSLTPRSPRDKVFPPAAERIASIAARYPGPLGDAWVLPWALALDRLPEAEPVAIGDLPSAIADAETLAAELTATVWKLPVDEAASRARDCVRSLLGPKPDDGFARLDALAVPDAALAGRLLGLIRGIGHELVASGSLSGSGHVWWLSPRELERSALGRVPGRTVPDRWEPLVFAVAEDRGRMIRGRAAAPGIGAGRAFQVDDRTWLSPPPRRVLIAPAAVPQLASMIWGAAGLVANTGSEGAHLFEVARSLGVPAVLGVEVEEGRDRIVAVNGDAGTVSVLDPGAGTDDAVHAEDESSIGRRLR